MSRTDGGNDIVGSCSGVVILMFKKDSSTMKLYIIAGEPSGDLHGSNLIKALKKQRNDIKIRCWGGDLMEEAGATLVKHYRDLAFMGFAEVLMNLKTILGNLRFCKRDILEFRPDAIILIDYPGFNLRIAQWAKQQGIRVFYYISPQIWAWKENRIHTIKKSVDKMFVVLPFEKSFYRKHHYEVEFVGHPLLDVIASRKKDFPLFIQENILPDKPIVALLPGSRKQEIKSMLPTMLSVQKSFPEFQFIIAGAPGQTLDFYRQFIGESKIPILFGKTYKILEHASVGIVTSGTATLEAGLFSLPQVVCYKGNSISYSIAKRLVKVKYISLVNLILDKQAVKELIQQEMNSKQVIKELELLLFNEERKKQLADDYTHLQKILGGGGASERTANEMLKILDTR